MKKLKVILLIILLTAGINVVKAENKCEKLQLKIDKTGGWWQTGNDFFKFTGYRLFYDQSEFITFNRYFILEKNNGNESYVAYCRNAGKPAVEDTCVASSEQCWPPSDYKNEYDFVCKEKVFDVDGTEKSNSEKAHKAYEYGIITLLKAGPEKKGGDDKAFAISNMAQRAYEMLWIYENTNLSSKDKLDFKAMKYYAYKALENETIIGKINTINSKLKAKYINTKDDINKFEDYLDSELYKSEYNNDNCAAGKCTIINGKFVNEVNELIISALNASIKYLEDGVATVTVNDRYENSASINKNVKEFIHEVSFNKFDLKDTKTFLKAEFNCTNCTNEINYKIYVDNNGKREEIKGKEINLLNYTQTGDGKLKIIINFIIPDNFNSNKDIKYNLHYTGYDKTISTEAYVVQDGSCPGCQLFYMLYAKDNLVPIDMLKEFSFNITPAPNKNCTTHIDNLKCSTADSEIDLIEGNLINEENCEEKLNVSECIIDGNDAAGNEYKITNANSEVNKGMQKVVNNKYCSVYCKEDFHFTLPGIKNVKEGGYFNLSATIKGTKTCYTNEINTELFKEELNSKINEQLNAYNSLSDYDKSKMHDITLEIEKMIEDYNSCSSWEMEYDKFDPKISFWYQESAMDLFEKTKQTYLDTLGKITETSNSYSQCNKEYGNCEAKISKTEEYFRYCKEVSTGNYSCNNYPIQILKNETIVQSITKVGDFETNPQIYHIYPYSGYVNKNIDNTNKIDGLPVDLTTEHNVYFDYTLQVEDLGEYFNTGKLGRIWDYKNKDNVVVKVLEKNKEDKECSKNITNGSLKTDVLYENNNTSFENGVYVCQYQITNDGPSDNPKVCNPSDPTSPGYNKNWQEEGWLNGCEKPCPPTGCLPTCDPCEKPIPCPTCPPICVNCIYNNIGYRPITPGDINPNDREMGKNWKWDDEITTALELKAYVTSTEIASDGESIYDSEANSNNDYIMTIELDTKLINKIRNYSKKHEKTGGYATNTLKCYDYNNHKNVFCYSTFIDDLIYEGYDKNIIVENRLIGKNAEESHNLRKDNANKLGYWTTWDEASWTIKTTHELAYYKENYGNIGIGPAWK